MVVVRGIQALDPQRPSPYLIAGDIALIAGTGGDFAGNTLTLNLDGTDFVVT